MMKGLIFQASIFDKIGMFFEGLWWKLFFSIIKAVSWILDLLTQLFFIFAGMTPVSNGDVDEVTNELVGVDIVNFFLNQDSFQKAYLWLCLVALGLVIVFAISKVIKQDYFDRGGPRSKAPIFRKVTLSFIAFICVIPVFLFLVDIVGALALLVMKAMGYRGGGIGTMLFNMSWSDDGVLFQKLGESLSTQINDPSNFGWYRNDTYFHFIYNEPAAQKWNGEITIPGYEAVPQPEFYWWMYALGAFAIFTSLFQMIMAMISRLYKLVALFLVAPSPISQIVLDDGAKFKTWVKRVLEEAMKVVGCVMSLMIFLLIITAVEDLDLMAFAYTDEAASAMNLIGTNSVTSNLASSGSLGDKIANGTIDVLGRFGKVLIVMGGAGAIKDIDSVVTPLLAGGSSSMDMGGAGQAVAGGVSAVAGGAMKLAGAGVGATLNVAKKAAGFGLGKLGEHIANNRQDKAEAEKRVADLEKKSTENPTNPTNPENPDPVDPSNPTNPENPDPVDSSNPTNPENPDPVDPSNPTDSDKDDGDEKASETPKDGIQAINGPLSKKDKKALTKSMAKKVTAERKAREKNDKRKNGKNLTFGKVAVKGLKTLGGIVKGAAGIVASTALSAAKGVIASTSHNDASKFINSIPAQFGSGYKAGKSIANAAAKTLLGYEGGGLKKAFDATVGFSDSEAGEKALANRNAARGKVKSDDEISNVGSEIVNKKINKINNPVQKSTAQQAKEEPLQVNQVESTDDVEASGMQAAGKEPSNVKIIGDGVKNLNSSHAQNVLDSSNMVIQGSEGVETAAQIAAQEASGTTVDARDLTSNYTEEELQTMMNEYEAAEEEVRQTEQAGPKPGDNGINYDMAGAVTKRNAISKKISNLSTVDKMKMEKVKMKNASVQYKEAVIKGDKTAATQAQERMKTSGAKIQEYSQSVNKTVSSTKKKVANAKKVSGKVTTAGGVSAESAASSVAVGKELIKKADNSGMSNIASSLRVTVGAGEREEIDKQDQIIAQSDNEINAYDETLATQNEELSAINSDIQEVDSKLKPFVQMQAGGKEFRKDKHGKPILSSKLNRKQKREAQQLLKERDELVKKQEDVEKNVTQTQTARAAAVDTKEKAVTAKQVAQQGLSAKIKQNKGNAQNTAGDNLYIAQTEHQQATAAYNEAVSSGKSHEVVVAAQARMQETGAALNKAQKTYNKEVKKASKKLSEATGKIPVFNPKNNVTTSKQSASILKGRIVDNLSDVDTSNISENYSDADIEKLVNDYSEAEQEYNEASNMEVSDSVQELDRDKKMTASLSKQDRIKEQISKMSATDKLRVEEARFKKATDEYKKAVNTGVNVKEAKKKMQEAHASVKVAKKNLDKSLKTTTKAADKKDKEREKFVKKVRQKYAPSVDFEVRQQAVKGESVKKEKPQTKVGVSQQTVASQPKPQQAPAAAERIKVIVDVAVASPNNIDDDLNEATQAFVKVANNHNLAAPEENVDVAELQEKIGKLAKIQEMGDTFNKGTRLEQVLKNSGRTGHALGTLKKHAKMYHRDSYNSAVNGYNDAMDRATQAMELYKSDQNPDTLMKVQTALKEAVEHNKTIRNIEVKIKNDKK